MLQYHRFHSHTILLATQFEQRTYMQVSGHIECVQRQAISNDLNCSIGYHSCTDLNCKRKSVWVFPVSTPSNREMSQDSGSSVSCYLVYAVAMSIVTNAKQKKYPWLYQLEYAQTASRF